MVAEEMGLLGLTSFLVVLAIIVLTAIRRYASLPDARQPLALTAIAAFLGVLTSAAFDKHFFDLRYQHISALFWGLGAIVLLSSQSRLADDLTE
jgi:O-antigen ligase